MRNLLKHTLLIFALALCASSAAFATSSPTPAPVPCSTADLKCKPAAAPEIEPGLAVVGVAVLAGGLAVLRARRRK